MPNNPALRVYDPINRLKPVADDIWIVDGPEVRMHYFGLRLPFTTRMTVVRLPDGAMWLHSPTEPTPQLRAEIAALGLVGFLISPNRLHTTWIAAWQALYPDAVTAGVATEAPRSSEKIPFRLDLTRAGPFPWSDAIAQVLLPESMFSEAVFFHAPSHTLIVTDVIENFERTRIMSRWLRLLLDVTGPLHPHGTMPPDMRLSFRRHRPALRAAVAHMRNWAPERIILAHGKWYENNGARELERAFRWVGER